MSSLATAATRGAAARGVVVVAAVAVVGVGIATVVVAVGGIALFAEQFACHAAAFRLGSIVAAAVVAVSTAVRAERFVLQRRRNG